MNATKWERDDPARMTAYLAETLPAELLFLVCDALIREDVERWAARAGDDEPVALLALGRRWAIGEASRDELVEAAHRLDARCETLDDALVRVPIAAAYAALVAQRAGLARDAVEALIDALSTGLLRDEDVAPSAEGVLARRLRELVPWIETPCVGWERAAGGAWITSGIRCELDAEGRLASVVAR